MHLTLRFSLGRGDAVHTCAEMLGRRGDANILLKCHALCPICLTFLVVHFYTYIYVSILNLWFSGWRGQQRHWRGRQEAANTGTLDQLTTHPTTKQQSTSSCRPHTSPTSSPFCRMYGEWCMGYNGDLQEAGSCQYRFLLQDLGFTNSIQPSHHHPTYAQEKTSQ